MVTINIKQKANISGLNEENKNLIYKLLSISNPLFIRKIELNLSVWGISKQLKYFEDLKDGTLDVPIGSIPDVISLLLNNGVDEADIKVIDNRVNISNTNYFSTLKFTGKLRDYQQKIVDNMKDRTVGIIEAMTGSGKTVAFIAHICDKKINTLILVNTIELANQSINALIEFSNLTKKDIGFIGSGTFNIKPITVALHQTVMRLPQNKIDGINKNFGQVIADEVHICAAELYYKNMTSLSMKYKFGFSATPERADGLTKVIFWATGPLLYKVLKSDLKKSLIMPTLTTVNTNYYFPLFDSSDYTYMMTDLAENESRNKFIADYILKNFKANKYFVCVLCSHIAQVENLSKKLGDKAAYLTSKMNKKSRAEVINKLNEKQIKFIVATYSLFSTGIDVKHLNVLVLAAPKKSKVLIKQSAGRIMRISDGKTEAQIIDFVDDRVEMLRNQAKVRHKILKNL